jgi:iron-sulfur cluster assembly protein
MIQQPVSITDRASEEILQIMSNKKIPTGYFLRVTVKGSRGCGGAEPTLGFDKPQPTDEIYSVSGLSVLIDKRHLIYVLGYEIDFVENEQERGFALTKR